MNPIPLGRNHISNVMHLQSNSSARGVLSSKATRRNFSCTWRTTNIYSSRPVVVSESHNAARNALSKHTRSVSFFRNSQGPARVQRVRFAPHPGLKWYQQPWGRRILTFILLWHLTNLLRESLKKRSESEEGTLDLKKTIQTVTSNPEEQKAGANAEPISQEDEEQEEALEIDADDAWFITCTWPKKKPDKFYKGTDQEWKQFQAFSQDKARKDSVNHQAVQFIEMVVKANPPLAKVLGEPTRPTIYWLDFDYPTNYCDGYEASGIVVADDLLAWGTRDFQENDIHKFIKLLSSPWFLMKTQWTTFKQAWKDREQFKAKIKDYEKTVAETPEKARLSDLLTPGMSKVVRASASKFRTPTMPTTIPKGCIMVSGRIDVAGSRAWAAFSIVGFYHPEQAGWYDIPRIKLGAIRPLRLVPKG